MELPINKIDENLMEVFKSTNESMELFLDSVFQFIAKNDKEALKSVNGLDTEHFINKTLNKWRLKVKQTNSTENPKATAKDAPPVENTVPDVAVEVECSSTEVVEVSPREKTLYYWSQTIEDLEIRVPVPSHIRKGKELSVNIEKDRVSVSASGQNILQAPLFKPINASESLWDLTPQKHVTLHLNKLECVWWGTTNALEGLEGVVEGAVEAERSLHSLPNEEQMEISKLMYDAEQKAAGKPTADAMSMETLRKAWDAEGSPFKGQPFDPSKLNFTPQ